MDDKNDPVAAVAAAYFSANKVAPADIPKVIETIRASLASSASSPDRPPAVDPKKAVTNDHIACLDCGAKMKMLKRHLAADHDLTPEQYRLRWKLPADYPMTAPGYGKIRSSLAKAQGLGIGPKRGKK